MKTLSIVIIVCAFAGAAFSQNFGIGVGNPIYKLHVNGQGHFSRDNVNECCSGGDFTISLAENTAGTGKVASIQFHNSGVSEGYIKLSNGGARRMIFGSYQTTMGIEASGNIVGGRTSQMWTTNRTNGVSCDGVWRTIDGLEIVNFNLERSATVQIIANGTQRATGGTCHIGYRKVVDGTAYGDGSHGERINVTNSSDHWWDMWTYASYVNLPAGNHTIAIQARQSSGAANVCHICREAGGPTGYTDCDLVITAVYD